MHAVKTENLIELIAGPCCGMRVRVPRETTTFLVKYHGGAATYVFEDDHTAVYVCG